MPTLFNGCGFGPPLPLTAASSWTWVDHPVSGLQCLTIRPLQTCSRSGSASLMLNLAGHRNSPDRSTKSTRFTFWCSTACKHRVSGSLSLPSRGSFHLSLTVLCSIGHQSVFSLTGWSPRVPARFLVSRGTLDPAAPPLPSPTGLSPSLAGLPRPFRWDRRSLVRSEPRGATHPGLGSSGFARRYSRNHVLFSPPPAT